MGVGCDVFLWSIGKKWAVGDGYGEKKEFKVRSFLLHSFAETKSKREKG